MSLKAKIEAVIYASEEPVTLAQLTGLLGLEAEQALERLAARQQTLHLAGEEAQAEQPAEPADTPAEDAPASSAETADAADLTPAEPSAPEENAPNEVDEDDRDQDTAAEKRRVRERDRQVRDFIREQIEELIADYATSERGLEVREVAGGYRLGTKPEYHDAVRGFVRRLKPPLKLTLQALETLAVVAYKQPVTAPEVSEIRGVDSGGVLGSLMTRKLVTTAGRKQVIGRPILYKTTKDFLLRFGLKDIAELPSIEEFEKLAGEMAEQEEIPMPEHQGQTATAASKDASAEERITHENLEAEKDATEPQADGDSDDLGGEQAGPDDSNLASDDLPAIDGRVSSLPPDYDKPGDDPSADEAAIQSEGEGV